MFVICFWKSDSFFEFLERVWWKRRGTISRRIVFIMGVERYVYTLLWWRQTFYRVDVVCILHVKLVINSIWLNANVNLLKCQAFPALRLTLFRKSVFLPCYQRKEYPWEHSRENINARARKNLTVVSKSCVPTATSCWQNWNKLSTSVL